MDICGQGEGMDKMEWVAPPQGSAADRVLDVAGRKFDEIAAESKPKRREMGAGIGPELAGK